MATEGKGSVTHWIGALKAGDHAAAQALWERYFDRLVRLACAKLRTARRSGSGGDEEDAALSAFDSFCAGAVRGRFPQLRDRGDLWRLLVVITVRKAQDQVQRENRLKRGGSRVVSAADLSGLGHDAGPAGLEQVVGTEPSPEFAALVADECRRLLGGLRDDTLRQIALLRMEGYENAEIAARLGCGLRTVQRKLDLIRKTWLAQESL
jgi:DNA-directed RNA polymerase specialized sigma24 family protein